MRIILTLLLGALFTIANGQVHVCGNTAHDQVMLEAKARIAGPSKYEHAGRLEKIYIPVRYKGRYKEWQTADMVPVIMRQKN